MSYAPSDNATVAFKVSVATRHGFFESLGKFTRNAWLFGYEKVLDPSLCWIIPAGADQKPVKIAFEGDLYTNEFDNYDWSKDIHVYEKVGVVCMMDNAIHVYKDTSLSKNGDFILKDTVQNVISIQGPVTTVEG